MKNLLFSEFSLIQMKLFLEVAKERSFVKAAENMQMEHSTASRKIALLEQELGVKLFARSRPLLLTAEGQYLYDSWETIVAQIDNSLQQLFQMNRRHASHLVVCAGDSINKAVFQTLLQASASLTQQHPGLDCQYEVLPLEQCYQKLKAGTVDVFIGPPLLSEHSDRHFSYTKIATVSKMICMRTNNPLSSRKVLEISDLEEQNFVVFAPSWNSATIDSLVSACKGAGFEPNIIRKVTNAHELITGLQRKNDVFLCDRFFRDVPLEQFKLAELRGMNSEFNAYWQTNNLNPCIKPFIQAVKTAFEEYSA